MDRDNSPSALDTELLEEGRRHEGLRRGESVWVQQGAADDADEDDAEAPAEYLRAVPNHGAAGHSAKVGDDLRDSDGIGGEVVLVGKERGVEILRAMRLGQVSLRCLYREKKKGSKSDGFRTYHEVKASHQEYKVDQQ